MLSEDADDPGSISNLSRLFGGTGSNRYEYLQNAPVNISGGSGTDTVVINGTAIADQFIISEKFVAGAGRVTYFKGIEKLEVNAAGGDDQIYVLGAPSHLEVTVRGGTGNDRIHLGGDHPTMFFDPPEFTYQPPSYTVPEAPYIEYNVLKYNPPRFYENIPFWGSRSLWNIITNGGVTKHLEDRVTDWVQGWYANNKARWRYIDVRYKGGLDGLISDTLRTIDWQWSWGSWWSWSPRLTFSYDMPEVNVEYGIERTPPPRQVTPPKITIDPDPFGLKIDSTHNLDGIAGRVTIDDADGTDKLIVHGSEAAASANTALVNATFLNITQRDDRETTRRCRFPHSTCRHYPDNPQPVRGQGRYHATESRDS